MSLYFLIYIPITCNYLYIYIYIYTNLPINKPIYDLLVLIQFRFLKVFKTAQLYYVYVTIVSTGQEVTAFLYDKNDQLRSLEVQSSDPFLPLFRETKMPC